MMMVFREDGGGNELERAWWGGDPGIVVFFILVLMMSMFAWWSFIDLFTIIIYFVHYSVSSLVDVPSGSVVKNLPAMQETWVWSLGQEDPLEKEMATHSIFLPGESQGQRSLVGYSPWGHEESDPTERLSMHTHSDSTRGHNPWGWHVWTRAELAPPVFSLHVKVAFCKRGLHQLWKDDSSYLAVLWDWEVKLTRKGPELHSSSNLMSPSCPWRSLKAPNMEREITK